MNYFISFNKTSACIFKTLLHTNFHATCNKLIVIYIHLGFFSAVEQYYNLMFQR